MLTSNSSGTVIPIPDNPSPLPWNPLWLPRSLLPPDNITPFKILTAQSPQECLQQTQALLQEPNLESLLVGVFSTYDNVDNKYKCRIYTTNNQTRHQWNQWKNNTPSDNINGMFFIYRPWLNQSTQPTPLPQDKQALVWMIPNDPIPTQVPEETNVTWSCPLKLKKCPQTTSKPTANLTWRNNIRTNQPTDPCFMNDKGCQGELNILNRNLTENQKNCPNIHMPYTKQPGFVQTPDRFNKYQFRYNFNYQTQS